MQAVLDDFLVGYNQRRPHQGRGMNRTGLHPLHIVRSAMISRMRAATGSASTINIWQRFSRGIIGPWYYAGDGPSFSWTCAGTELARVQLIFEGSPTAW